MIAHFAQAIIALALWVVFFGLAGGALSPVSPEIRTKFPTSSIIVAKVILVVGAVLFGYGAFEMTKFALGA